MGSLSIVGVSRWHAAFALPKTDEEAANLLGLCVAASALTAFGGDALLSCSGASGPEPYLMLVPPVVFVSGVFLVLNYWNSCTKHFRRLSVARVTSSLAITGTQLGAGFSGHAMGWSLIGARVVDFWGLQ